MQKNAVHYEASDLPLGAPVKNQYEFLCDETTVQGAPWREFKNFAMKGDFTASEWFLLKL